MPDRFRAQFEFERVAEEEVITLGPLFLVRLRTDAAEEFVVGRISPMNQQGQEKLRLGGRPAEDLASRDVPREDVIARVIKQ